MTPAGSHPDERSQFRLLWRDATRRLLNAALLSRDADPAGVALWMLALLSTPPLLYSVTRGMSYGFLRRAPAEVLEATLLGDRLFFVTYAMLAALLVGSLLWDALFPDRAEQEIVGVLPVRPRTFAAARLAAALRLGLVVALAVSVPGAFIFTLFAASHPALRALHTIGAGHVLAVAGACLFVFVAVLAVRGVVAITMGTRAGTWMAVALQIVALVSLVDVFFFLPRVLDVLAQAARSDDSAMSLPPLWFAALFSIVAGDAVVDRPGWAAVAAAAPCAGALLAGVLYLGTAAHVGRRLVETRERHASRNGASLARAFVGIVRTRSTVRSIFLFSLASLTRSRDHLLRLSTYAGLAVAALAFRVITAGMYRPVRPGPRAIDAAPERMQFAIERLLSDAPAAAQLSVPLILIFILVLGLLACFRAPTDAGANWTFRLLPPAPRDAASATELVLTAAAITPIALLTLMGGLALWPVGSAVAAAVTTWAAGLLLVELSLTAWHIVPFTCAHEASSETVRWKWMLGLVAFAFYGFGLARLEAWALQSRVGVAAFLIAAATTIVVARARRGRRLSGTETAFEDKVEETATLRLSQALS